MVENTDRYRWADSPFTGSPVYNIYNCVNCGHTYKLRTDLPQSRICVECLRKVSNNKMSRGSKIILVLQILAAIALFAYGAYKLITKKNGSMIDLVGGLASLAGGVYMGEKAARRYRSR